MISWCDRNNKTLKNQQRSLSHSAASVLILQRLYKLNMKLSLDKEGKKEEKILKIKLTTTMMIRGEGGEE